jgi:urease accessory protein
VDVYTVFEGNRGRNETLDARLADEAVERVTLTDEQRRRSRCRTETDAGREVGIVAGHDLESGDVLATEDGDAPRLEVALEPIDALRIDLADAAGSATTAVALGHAAGNRHWAMAVRASAVLFPATESRERMRETVDPHLPEGATVEWVTVPLETFDSPGHDHGHGGHS